MFTDLNKETKLFTVAPIVIASIFFYGFIISFLSPTNTVLRQQFLLTIATLFLINPIIRHNVNLDKVVKISGMILLVYTFLLYLILLVFPGSFGADFFLKIFEKYGGGGYGMRAFTEDGVFNFQLGTTPFLYLPLALYVKSYLTKKNALDFIAVLLLIVAIAFSGLRGLMVSSILICLFLVFINFKIVGRVLFIAMTFVILAISIPLILENTNAFSKDEESNNIKLGHAESVIDNLTPINFLTGNGLASLYYSKGIGYMIAHTEITPLDMFRYFGFVFTIILYLALIFPATDPQRYRDKNVSNVVIFLVYIINSFTNPVLFNSYGLLIALWYWSKILERKSKNDKQFVLI